MADSKISATPAATTVALTDMLAIVQSATTKVATFQMVVDAIPTEIQFACSDETTALAVATSVITFRMPYAMTLTDIRASVGTAPTGSTIILGVNQGGVSILSTDVSIDISEKTSVTAAVQPVISTSALTDDAEITVDIDAIGSTIAGTGLKVTLIGTRA